jgi:hypothetical protein
MSTGDIFLIFYTNLLEEPQSGCLTSLRNMVYIDAFWLTAATNYFQPPFSHVKIAFREPNDFITYSFTRSGFTCIRGTFLHKRGYCMLRLKVSYATYKAAKDLCESFNARSTELKFSVWKMSKIAPWARFYCYLAPVEPPTPSTNAWFCSEFVTFVLQDVGVVAPGSIHCSHISPTELFLLLLDAPQTVLQYSYNPFFTERTSASYPVTCLADTKAFDVYTQTMRVNPKMPVQQIKIEGLRDSLCIHFNRDELTTSRNEQPTGIETSRLPLARINQVAPIRTYRAPPTSFRR